MGKQNVLPLKVLVLGTLIFACVSCRNLQDFFTLVELSPGLDRQSMEKALAPLIPPGYMLKELVHSRPQVYVLVLSPVDEAAKDPTKDVRGRELLVLMRETEDKYRLVVRSSKALAPYGWDDHFPDSLSEVKVTGTQLRILHYGGGRQRWGREDIFHYDPSRDMWYWTRTLLDYSDSQDLEAEGEQWIFTPEMIGEIPLTNFDITAKTFSL